jgi:AraC-like DNA-binding protein
MLPESPPLPYSLRQLTRLAQQIRSVAPQLTIGEHHLFLHHFGFSPLKAGGCIMPHAHPNYEVHIVVSHPIHDLTDNGRVLERGTVQLHGPEATHAYHSPDAPSQLLAICFSINPHVPVSAPVQALMPNVLWEIQLLFDEAAQRLPGWRDRTHRYLCAILARALQLASATQENSEPRCQEESEFVEVIDHYFRTHLHLLITLDDVADYVGVSRRTLTRTFRRLTDETVMSYLHKLRMYEAHTLVVNTTLPISEIAKSVGIPHPAYFSSCFHTFHRHSPHRIRQMLAQGEYVSAM